MSRFAPKPKAFSWSYSKLKNFESCPKRHFHADLKKDFKDELGEELLRGNEIHDALAKRISKGTPLPAAFAPYEKWVERIVTDAGNPNISILVEQKLAITENFEPCEFFGSNAWFRAVVDVAKLVGHPDGDIALVGDWKTGKILEDSVQLGLAAQCVFAHYPSVVKIRTEFIWLKDDCTTKEIFSRADMADLWSALWPRVEALKAAHDNADYPATPNHLCRKWCPVTICAHHGN